MTATKKHRSSRVGSGSGEESLASRARRYAQRRHRGSTGRDGASPYFEHVAEVVALVAAAGASERLVTAAYLHDVVEDTTATVGDISSRFGSDVAAIVEHVTNQTADPVTGRELSWLEQKRLSLVGLGDAAHDVVWLKAADLCANIAELLRNFTAVGSRVWGQYEASPAQQLGYYLRLGDVVLDHLDDSQYLHDQVAGRVAALRRLARREGVRPRFPSI